MTSTENYKLTKFSEPEYYNVNLFNENMDKVDAAVKEAYTITPERIGYAGVENAGLIKLYSSGSTNRSGLVVYEDGSCVVNTKPDRGITRDGVGQIGINPATQTEVDTGTEAYKPVTPKTLRDLKCIYEADISKVGSGNNILYITIPGVTSYDDLNGKSVKLYTGIYSNNVKQTVYVNINGLGSRAIKRIVPDNTYESSVYEAFEINRHTVMELYISGTSVFWVNPTYAIASADAYGVIKIGSGLYQSSDGYLTVYAGGESYGIRKSGDGKIITVPATEADIDAKTNSYKVITPSNLEYAVASTEAAKRLDVYNTTSQRVGTWVDGTPVWRLALAKEGHVWDVGNGYASPNYGLISFYHGKKRIEFDLVRDVDKVIILNSMVHISVDETKDYKTYRADKFEFMSVKTSDSLAEVETYRRCIVTSKELTDMDYFGGGYIEFVTPASNLKTTALKTT